jgi:hypothetical protein
MLTQRINITAHKTARASTHKVGAAKYKYMSSTTKKLSFKEQFALNTLHNDIEELNATIDDCQIILAQYDLFKS